LSELARIEARLRALAQIQEVVRAMRGLASARLRESERMVATTARYCEMVADAYGRLRTGAGVEPEREPPAVLVVTAEHGFVGAFARRMAEAARERLGTGTRPFVVGRRGAARLEEVGLHPRRVLAQAPHAGAVVTAGREVIRALGRPARLRLLYARVTKAGMEVVDRLVPPPQVAGAQAPAPLPRTHLPLPALLEALAEELVTAAVVEALAASFAAETLMRLRTCEQAGRNIERRSEELLHLRHRLRQESITAELFDVVTGAEAVRRSIAGGDDRAD